MKKNNDLLDEEVLVVPTDSISPVDKMLLKRLWNRTDGNYCEDFDYMYANYRADVFSAIKDKLSIEGSNGKKRRKLGLAEVAMNPNYVITEASLTPKEMESMSAIYPHKVNRATYEDNKVVECAYMAGSFTDSITEFFAPGMTQAVAASVMQITASTEGESNQQNEENLLHDNTSGHLDRKPAASVYKDTSERESVKKGVSLLSTLTENIDETSNDSLEDILEDESDD